MSEKSKGKWPDGFVPPPLIPVTPAREAEMEKMAREDGHDPVGPGETTVETSYPDGPPVP